MTNISSQMDKACKLDGSSNRASSNSSRIFRRNRAVGYVSNSIPCIVRYIRRRKDNLIITCIGRSFQVYTASHFRLIHVSGIHPDDITAMAADRWHTFTASAKCIYAWRSGKHIVHIYKGHTKNVHLLLPFGKTHLIAIDEANVMRIWQTRTAEVYSETPFDKDDFLISAIAHPPTYLNKIVLGSSDGQLKLWNIKDNRLIHTFTAITRKNRINCIEPAPALDVVCLGYQDGGILLLNLKFDEMLMEFKQDWGAVCRISFRTDGPPVMVTAGTNGYLAFWNLEEKKVVDQLQAHEEAITTAVCFPSEPLLLSASPDNSLKLWIFDMPDGGARLLRIREGHTAPPVCIRYHGSSGTSILSAGEDSSLRVFSTISESLNKSMGKASYNRKASKKKNRFQEDSLRMPPIIEFTSETTREKEWDNIAAIHSGLVQATTWSFHKNRMGEHHLVPEKFHNKNRTDFSAEATCLTLTHCGNFVVIGYSSGDVERFNVQSGIHRATYGTPAHKAPIRGVVSDNLNQFVVTGCSEGFLKFWRFKENTAKPTTSIKLTDGVSLLRIHRESGMIAMVLTNFIIYIMDADTKAIVRKFEGHTARVTDLTFSPDSRWLISAAMDSTIKVWDIPSSYMVDHFKLDRPCVSLTMSPTGDFLATAHVGCLGLYLWSNKTLFNQISLRSMDPFEEAPFVGLPLAEHDEDMQLEEAVREMSSMDVDSEGEESNDSDDGTAKKAGAFGEAIDMKYETPDQLDADLITCSTLAASRWQNLMDLELIKKRNKPKAPPKVPKQAPFFLPTVAGLEMKFDLADAANRDGDQDATSRALRKPKNIALSNLTNFGRLLIEKPTEDSTNSPTTKYEKCVEYLKELGPSMISYEIKSMHPLSGGTEEVMVEFLKTIEFMFSTNRNFELAQSYLSAFLRTHGLSLTDFPNVLEALQSLSKKQEQSWARIEEKLMFNIGVVSALRNFAH